nr:hypothetical protein [Tanacetum cinerariifolium]
VWSVTLEETLGTPMEVKPLNQTKLEDVGLNNHSISISYKEVPIFNGLEPQPQLLHDPKKHYGFKPCLLGQGGSLGVDLSNREVLENNFLKGLSLPMKPKELEKGRKAHLLEDNQIPSVAVFDAVSFYALFQALGGNTHGLDSIWEETGQGYSFTRSGFKDALTVPEDGVTIPSDAVKTYKRPRQKLCDDVRP